MADFTADLQSFRPSFPFFDVDQGMEPMNQFIDINPTILENSNLNFHSFMPYSTSDNFFSQQAPEFPGNLAESLPGMFNKSNQSVVAVSQLVPIVAPGNESEIVENKKRKAVDASESSSLNSSPQVSECGSGRKNSSSRRGKRVKSSEDDQEKPKDVVHVRARRGQATDSHSLAERVRRGKINERLRCLQNIVPGCYKTMGMAVMLDEIINYVQSLQNQVEFLSMKLTAASTFYDFNAETDAIEAMQRAKAQQAKELERALREGSGGAANSFHSPTWSH
ncbi:hypothetical protein Tsubulata_040202 [Turnera subulata]|uniref:BHLH domain-containing protein n=1 Tax=Turnera subulata TaxID=218843 RepID=A0A9Q0FAP0_9ROSI|nr:hypothetical protein Tsubulata_040202 [Turnera subulata]